jgi:hypothetical protein
MYIYVRSSADGDRNYHWCQNCPSYPSTFSHSTSRRPVALLCPECEQSERDGACDE